MTEPYDPEPPPEEELYEDVPYADDEPRALPKRAVLAGAVALGLGMFLILPLGAGGAAVLRARYVHDRDKSAQLELRDDLTTLGVTALPGSLRHGVSKARDADCGTWASVELDATAVTGGQLEDLLLAHEPSTEGRVRVGLVKGADGGWAAVIDWRCRHRPPGFLEATS